MTAINEGSATTYDKYNFYGQALQQRTTGNQQVRFCCGRDETMLRSIESAAAAVGDEIYEHPHQYPHQSHCHRNMPPLTTLDNGKEKTNRFGNCFGCEHFLVRSESMLGEEDEEDLPYPPSSHNNRRLMNHDDAVLYGAYLSNITPGGSSRPSLDTVDDAGERRQCVGEAERMVNVGERGCHHIQHQQQLILSQPPMSRHHLLQAFGSDGVILEPAAALSPSEQSTDVICLSSHRSYAYPPPHPPATAYTHIATEGNALPMVGHPLRHQNHPGTTTPSIKSTAAACCALSADGSGRCEVVGDCQSRELETFAEHFKQRRIRLGATQADVGAALGKLKLAGVACLSQSTICRFESLTLSHSNMVALKPILAAWLADMERAARERRSALDVEAMHSGSNRLEDKRRKRTSIAGPEKRSLEAYFAIQPRPSGEKIVRIADKLELRKDVVRVWFCNQRQKQKRMKFSSANIKTLH